MSPRTKVILWLCALGLIDVVIPVPILAVILVYAAATRPPWLPRLVAEVYQGR